MAGAVLRLIVGLGNPGPEYEQTRHNAGFWLVDELARRHGGVFRNESKHSGQLARIKLGSEDVWLLKPMSFMNRSGGPVASVLGFYKLVVADVLVAHDELDLPGGVVRLKHAGGHGGRGHGDHAGDLLDSRPSGRAGGPSGGAAECGVRDSRRGASRERTDMSDNLKSHKTLVLSRACIVWVKGRAAMRFRRSPMRYAVPSL